MPELSYRDELISIYSDTYKDVYGVRPRGFTDLSDEVLESKLERLQAELSRQLAEELSGDDEPDLYERMYGDPLDPSDSVSYADEYSI